MDRGLMLARRLRIAPVIPAAFALWTIIASSAFALYFPVARSDGPGVLWAWWSYLDYEGPHADVVMKGLQISAFVPVGLAVIAWRIWQRWFRDRRPRPLRSWETPKPPRRAVSGLHGTADWMTKQQARRVFSGHPSCGGVVVGELDGKLLLHGAGHGLVVMPTGGGKTSGVTVPSLCTYTGSVVVLDPSCQVGYMVRDAREEMGHKVIMLGPGGDGFNVLDTIDPQSTDAEEQVLSVVDWIGASVPKGDNEIFAKNGQIMQQAILADMLWDPSLPPERRNLREFRERMRTPEDELKGFLEQINAESRSKLARDLAGDLMGVTPKTFSGASFHAKADTFWLSSEPLVNMVSGNSFRAADLCRGDLSIFVQIPMRILQKKTRRGIASTIIGGLLNGLYVASSRSETDVLFLLDEARFLGRLDELSMAWHAARKYGASIVTMWQSLASMTEIWGENGPSDIMSAASWRLFSSVEDDKTAELVSKECGEYTALAYGVTQNRSEDKWRDRHGRAVNVSEQPRRLIKPDEVRTNLQAGVDGIVFTRGNSALRCKLASYYKRPEMAHRVRQDLDRYQLAAE